MTTDKETPYWEQDIAECLRVAAEIIGPNSYYLRAAEYIEEMRGCMSTLAKHVLAMETDAYLSGHPEWEHIVADARAAIRALPGYDAAP